MVHFETLQIGSEYDRPFLSDLWGYKSYAAISRGVVTPSGSKYIILFVTRDKQNSLTQYNDYIEGNQLFWEGEEKHGSDKRITNAAYNGDEIHLFYRVIHRSPFTYHGQLEMTDHRLRQDAPSVFFYDIKSLQPTPDLFDDLGAHQEDLQSLSETERLSVIKSRMGQGIFRYDLIRLWGKCAVTGLDLIPVLKASHIKPWRLSTNRERLDPYNGLLLTPTLDTLFDAGYISFREDGRIIILDDLSTMHSAQLYLDETMQLKEVFPDTQGYLSYHRDHILK